MTTAVYNFSEVRALQTDVADIYNRVNVGVQGGWITIAEAREAVGLPVADNQKVYLLDSAKMLIPEENINMDKQEADTNTEQEYEGAEVETQDDEEKQAEFKVIKEIDGEFCVIAENSGKNMGCYPTRELAEIRLRQISRFSDDQKIAYARDQFSTQEEAEIRAEKIGCVGFHTMDKDGKEIFMPCDSHDEYEKLVNGEQEG